MTAIEMQHRNPGRPAKAAGFIAVPSDDHVTIASHFGRARGFIVYSVEGEIEEVGYRTLAHEEKQQCGCGSDERPSRHQAVLDALRGCRTVIARGMGAHMYDDLQSCGINVILTESSIADVAVEQFVDGSLPERETLGCDPIAVEQSGPQRRSR